MSEVVYAIWLRNVKRFVRIKSRFFGSLGIPLFLIFGMGFGINLNVQGGYTKYIVPGAVAMSVLFASVASGIMVIWDKQFGILKETLVAPVSRLEIVIGQTVGGATSAVLQGLILFTLSFFITGFPSFMGIIIAVFFMLLIGISFAAMGIAFASRMSDMHGFQLVMNFLVFPLFGLSGAVFPIDKLPPAMRFLTMLDPLTYGVEGIRYGLLGISTVPPMTCLVVMGIFTIAMLAIGSYLFSKI